MIKPDYYSDGNKSCWDEMIDEFSTDDVIIFDCLCVKKYLYRAGKKEGNPAAQDLEKAHTYLLHAEKLREEVAGSYNTEWTYNTAKDLYDCYLKEHNVHPL